MTYNLERREYSLNNNLHDLKEFIQIKDAQKMDESVGK